MVRINSYLCAKTAAKALKIGYAAIAQLVERRHGKAKVTGSNPVRGSINLFPDKFMV